MEKTALNTTELLQKNLTDFLQEVRQDVELGKYSLQLADLLDITDIDMTSFLKRITNGFDLDAVKKVYDDIKRWESFRNDKDGVPYVTYQMKKNLLREAQHKSYKDTKASLENNGDFVNNDIEDRKSVLPIINCEVENAITDGYDSAMDEFEWQQQPIIEALETITPGQPQLLHFTREFTKSELKLFFQNMKKGGLISQTTNENHFNFVFGGLPIPDKQKPFEPLQWTEKTIKSLNYFVNVYFSNEKSKWDKAVQCFVWRGSTIKKKSLSTAIDKHDKPPECSEIIDKLLK